MTGLIDHAKYRAAAVSAAAFDKHETAYHEDRTHEHYPAFQRQKQHENSNESHGDKQHAELFAAASPFWLFLWRIAFITVFVQAAHLDSY